MIKVELTTVVYAVEAYNEEISQEFAISDEHSSVAELREEMKERGYDKRDYDVIYQKEIFVGDIRYGIGVGRSASEARKDLDTDLALGAMTTVERIKAHPERYID